VQVEQKIDKDSKDVKEETKDVKEEPKKDEKVAEKTTVSEQKGDKPDEEVDESTTEEEDEGYIADEIEEDDAEPEKPEEPPKVPRSGLSEEQQFIYDRLPEIVTYDKAGTEYRVKTDAELPKGFEFADQLTMTAFMRNINAQELNARDLQRQYSEQQSTASSAEFEARENEGIKSDIAELQRSGDLPKFKLTPDDPKFAGDKATEEAQKVLDYMNNRNEQYLAEYNQGRPYRHIGFREAFDLYKKANPGEIKSRGEHQEDSERQKIARETSESNVGLASGDIKKPTVRSGTTPRDILNRIDNM
jgi:hypothetical protein